MAPLKILIVGPKEADKSTIANFLAEHSDRLGGQERYQPTIGVRILELEKGKASVEIWDVSGDQTYEACWPAVMKDTDGVILVYNPESHVHESEAMLWYEWFMQNAGLDSSQCLIFEHSTGSNNAAIQGVSPLHTTIMLNAKDGQLYLGSRIFAKMSLRTQIPFFPALSNKLTAVIEGNRSPSDIIIFRIRLM